MMESAEGDAQCSVKLKRGRLDVEVEERQEKVQKGRSTRGGLDVGVGGGMDEVQNRNVYA